MNLMKLGGQRTLDRILEPGFVLDLESLPLADLRERRELVSEEEAWLSYLRRTLHARLDILDSRDRITAADGGLDLEALIASLVDGDGGSAAGSGRPLPPEVVEQPGGGRRHEERVVNSAGLDDYAAMSDEQIEARRAELVELEHEVSEARRSLHGVHATLTEELGRRLQAGEATAETLLQEEM